MVAAANPPHSSEDLFEDKTHQKIADTLYEIIENGEPEGITIGLEGEWGSGKSTVVSILKNKLLMRLLISQFLSPTKIL